jgi:hypothetical protein
MIVQIRHPRAAPKRSTVKAHVQLERLRTEHQDAEERGEWERRLRIIENAAMLAQTHGLPIPDWAQGRVALLRRRFHEYLRRRFEHTGNPMYAYEAYFESRWIGDPPPAWAVEYFDLSIMKFWLSFLEFEAGKRPNKPDEALCKAFGIKLGGKTGKGTVWSLRRDSGTGARWRRLGTGVASIMADWAHDGHTSKITDAAIEETMRRWNGGKRKPVSRSTVWRAWQRFQKECPDVVAAINGQGCRCCPVHTPTSIVTKPASPEDPFLSITRSLKALALDQAACELANFTKSVTL